MVIVNMHEAKTRLSELVRLVEGGERVVVARHGVPVAEIIRHEARPKKRRVGGQWKGKVWMSPDFDEPLPDLERAIYGE